MNWDRRAFVKFAVGAVAGIHASPLIPKIMDDAAIWTQNWSWVPKPEEGVLAFANTVNPVTGTGVRVRLVKSRMIGERIIRVEGNPEHPFSRGGVVPADIAAVQLLYNDEVRVSSPLLRNEKTGMYSEISWEQAFAIISSKFNELARNGKCQTVAALGDNIDCIHGEILKSFMIAYGSHNVFFPSQVDSNLAIAAWALTGQKDVGFDLANASYIVSFGASLLEGFGAPVATCKDFIEWKKTKATFVQIEPRVSITASLSDCYIACQPGTESLLALGIAAFMVEHGLIDDLATKAYGFAEFKTILLNDYSLERVASLSNVPASKIVNIAKAFANTPKAVAVCGPGPGGDPGRLSDFIAVMALNGLKGNMGKPGGLLIRKSLGLKSLHEIVNSQTPFDKIKEETRYNNVLTLAKDILNGRSNKFNLVLVAGGNPAYAGPQAGVMSDFLRSVPYVIAMTPQLDETAALANLILPTTTFLEGWSDYRGVYGSPVAVYGLARPLVRPYPQAKTIGDILLMLAAKLGGSVASALPFFSVKEVLKEQVASLGDFTELAQQSYFIQDKPMYEPFIFKTFTGKLEFYSQNLASFMENNLDSPKFLPHWKDPLVSKYKKGQNLVLSGIFSVRSAIGAQPLMPYLIKNLDDNVLRYKNELVVEINPRTAAELHLIEDSKITITSAVGSVNARVHLYAGASPGMIFMPIGLGHSAINDSYTLNKGENFYRIAEVVIDHISGLSTWGFTRVTVTKRG